MVHTIVINGETFTSENEVEERILDMDYTFPGWEIDPDYVNKGAETKVYKNPDREKGHTAKCAIFRKIDNHSEKCLLAGMTEHQLLLYRQQISASHLLVNSSLCTGMALVGKPPQSVEPQPTH